jgi:hypothetical protein
LLNSQKYSQRVCLTTRVSRVGKITIAEVENAHLVFTINILKLSRIQRWLVIRVACPERACSPAEVAGCLQLGAKPQGGCVQVASVFRHYSRVREPAYRPGRCRRAEKSRRWPEPVRLPQCRSVHPVRFRPPAFRYPSGLRDSAGTGAGSFRSVVCCCWWRCCGRCAEEFQRRSRLWCRTDGTALGWTPRSYVSTRPLPAGCQNPMTLLLLQVSGKSRAEVVHQ